MDPPDGDLKGRARPPGPDRVTGHRTEPSASPIPTHPEAPVRAYRPPETAPASAGQPQPLPTRGPSPGPSGWFACLQDVTESAADVGSPPTGRGHERAGRVDPFYVVARQRCPNRWSIPFRLELFVFARSGPVLVLAPLLAVLTLAGCGPKKTTTPAPSTATTAPGRGSSSAVQGGAGARMSRVPWNFGGGLLIVRPR